MSSATSTETGTFQPWHFFVIVTMLAATAAVLVARETSLVNLVLVSVAVMSVGLAAIAVHRTLAPLTGTEAGDRGPAVGGRTRLALEREKALVLRSIKELEFDRAMGKIAEADFHDMVGRLRARAIGLMKQLDEHEPGWRAEIERELARRLTARGVEAAQPAAAAGAPAGVVCGSCETPNDPDARFCKACGTKLAAGS
jgi:hypothetical protein